VTQVAFGLDLSGYSSGRTTLARVALRSDGTADADVFEVSQFGRKLSRNDLVEAALRDDRELIEACLNIGPLAVDVPIDLQGLPDPQDVKWLWQQTMRPIDFAFDALPPLADRIGAPVARFRNVLRESPAARTRLGQGLYETYPAACLEVLQIPHSPYKGSNVTMSNGTWSGVFEKKKKRETEPCIAKIAKELGFYGDSSLQLTDDEVDSVICALSATTADGEGIFGGELDALIGARLREKLGAQIGNYMFSAPSGYTLPRSRIANAIRVRKRPLSSLADLALVQFS
jgi:hypothetical protein